MRILFSCAKYLPHIGGPEIGTHNLAKELVKMGHDIHIACEDYSLDPDDPLNYDDIDEVKIHRYRKLNFSGMFKPFVALIVRRRVREFMKKFLKENTFDLIVSQFYISASVIKEFDTKTKLVYLQPSIAYLEYKKRGENSLGIFNKFDYFVKSKLGYNIEKTALESADIVLTQSSSMKKINGEIYGISYGKMKFFTQGVDLKKFFPKKTKLSFMKKHGLENKKVILTVSRLSAEKNNLGLIKVFSEMKTKDKALIIVGGGEEEEKLKNSVRKLGLKDSVHFLGEKKDPENYYGLGDVFILASKQEGFGTVFIEALASGLPIVGFKSDFPKVITAVKDIIGNSKCGFSVKDEKEMVGKLDLMLSNEKFLKQMSMAARKRASDYSWDKIAKDFLKSIGHSN